MKSLHFHLKSIGIFLLFGVVCFAALRGLSGGNSPRQAILAELGATRAVIFNGDDFGRSEWSNDGIMEAFRDGVLTSTSMEVVAPARDAAYALIRDNPGLDAGIHLELARDDIGPGLAWGPLSPAADVPTLVDKDGMFFTSILPLANADPGQVRRELEAQIKHALDNGVDVTHLDCHKGWYHDYNMRTLKPTLELAEKYKLPIRWTGRATDKQLVKRGIVVPDFTTMLKGTLPFEEKKRQLLESIDKLPEGITEYVFHPATDGYTDSEREGRTGDLRLLKDPDVRAALERNGIVLIGYKKLRDMQRRMSADNSREGKQ